MKKLIPLALALTFILLLAGCGDKQSPAANNESMAADSQQAAPSPGSSGPSEPIAQKEAAPPAENVPNAEHSFLGTVIEETTTYMIVEPSEDEEEREVADKIQIETGYSDCLYGEGRKIVVYYLGEIEAGSPATITVDSISTEGFREFTLSVMPSEKKDKLKIVDGGELQGKWYDNDVDLYYYGLDEVNITVDHQTIPLDEALASGKMTLNGLISKANGDVSDGIIEENSYDDGGSQVYQYDDYCIIKYHTLDGNRDVYIGTTDMDIHVDDR